MLLVVGCATSIILGPARFYLLSIIGDRRAEWQDLSSSFQYLSFWIVYFGLVLYNWKGTLNSYEGRVTFIVLAFISTSLVTESYSTRVISALFPFLIISMSQWNLTRLNIPLYLFIPYAFAQWLYWLRLI